MTPDSENTYWQRFVSYLRKKFLQSLPGIDAQKKMASPYRARTLKFSDHLSSRAPDPHEVSEIIETNIHHFLVSEGMVGYMTVKTSRDPEKVPCFII